MKFVSSWICRCVKVVADKLSICKIKIFGFYGFPKFVPASQWKTISYDDRMPPKTSFAFDCSKLNFSRFLFIAYSWCFFSNHVNNLKELHILKRATESIFYDESHIHLNVDFSISFEDLFIVSLNDFVLWNLFWSNFIQTSDIIFCQV